MSGEITQLELQQLLGHGMAADLHWFPGDVSPSRLAETLAGMANSQGGTVLLGIAPRTGQVLGIPEIETCLDQVFKAALLIEPVLILPLPQVLSTGESTLIRVTVPKGLPHVYSLDGRYLGRVGRHNDPLSARRLRQLLQERGVFQFESHIPPGASLDDLDESQIATYLDRINFPVGLPAEEVLLRRGCLRLVSGELQPTYAALLLFGRHPQQWLPNAFILAARFSSEDVSEVYIKQEIASNLPQQLHQAEQFVRDHLRTQVRLVGLTHQESLEYPLEAVRELLVNAVAHRDYSLQGDSVHLHIFSDHLAVHSPGGLPGPVNLDNLLSARFSRNPVIVQLLSDLGFVERLGYGLNRVVAVMRDQGLKPPHFDEVAGSFRVTMHRAPLPPAPATVLSAHSSLELNPRQGLALQHLADHHRITNRAYQDLCPDVHPETLRRDLADLVSRDILLKIGDKRATYYILKSPLRPRSLIS